MTFAISVSVESTNFSLTELEPNDPIKIKTGNTKTFCFLSDLHLGSLYDASDILEDVYDEATYRALNVGGGVVITLLEPSEDVREAALEEAKEAAEEAILGRINEISVSYDFQKYFTEVGSGKWAKQPANATTYETDEEHNLVEASYESLLRHPMDSFVVMMFQFSQILN